MEQSSNYLEQNNGEEQRSASPLQFNESFLSISQSNLSIASLSQQPPFSVETHPVRRYFDYDEAVWCRECGQVGHSASTCKSRKRTVGVCFCCGDDKHQVDMCKENVCIICGTTGCSCKRKARHPGGLLDLLDIDSFVSTYINECYRCGGPHSGLVCPEYMPYCKTVERCKFCYGWHSSCECPDARKEPRERRNKLFAKMRCFICGSNTHYHLECRERNFSLRTSYRFRGNEYSRLLNAYNAKNASANIKKITPRNEALVRGAYSALRNYRLGNDGHKRIKITLQHEPQEKEVPDNIKKDSRKPPHRGDFRITKDRFTERPTRGRDF